MSKVLQRITPWIVGAALAVSLSACGAPTTVPGAIAPSAPVEESMPPGAVNPDPSLEPIEPAGPSEDSDGAVEFDGAGVTTDTITANLMEIQIPSGLRIPEDTLVTEALGASIMMADADPAAVIAMVESSAAEAGYEIHAELGNGKVYVGNGNAVLFTADPMVQLITWGPESMKDVLAEL